jgi:hypothetical protein
MDRDEAVQIWSFCSVQKALCWDCSPSVCLWFVVCRILMTLNRVPLQRVSIGVSSTAGAVTSVLYWTLCSCLPCFGIDWGAFLETLLSDCEFREKRRFEKHSLHKDAGVNLILWILLHVSSDFGNVLHRFRRNVPNASFVQHSTAKAIFHVRV